MTHRDAPTGNDDDQPEQNTGQPLEQQTQHPTEQIEEHSLPGTNQAGKGPGESEEEGVNRGRPGTSDEARRPADAPPEDHVEEHSLPGTNQAGRLREEPPA